MLEQDPATDTAFTPVRDCGSSRNRLSARIQRGAFFAAPPLGAGGGEHGFGGIDGLVRQDDDGFRMTVADDQALLPGGACARVPSWRDCLAQGITDDEFGCAPLAAVVVAGNLAIAGAQVRPDLQALRCVQAVQAIADPYRDRGRGVRFGVGYPPQGFQISVAGRHGWDSLHLDVDEFGVECADTALQVLHNGLVPGRHSAIVPGQTTRQSLHFPSSATRLAFGSGASIQPASPSAGQSRKAFSFR